MPSIRELAAALGVSKSQIGRDVQDGMPTHDMAAARAWREANRDMSRTVEGRVDRQPPPAPPAASLAAAQADPAATADGADEAADPELLPDDTADYRKARTEREQIRRDRERMELDRDRGKLIDAADAARLAFTSFRALRDQAFNLPARLAPQCAVLTDALQIEHLLEAELTAVFGNFTEDRLLSEPSEDDDPD